MLPILLTIILNRTTEPEELPKPPWENGNSHLINASIQPTLEVTQVYYKSLVTTENINAGVSDITFIVTEI